MKKTLFLSAILGAALCSSAFAETTYDADTDTTTIDGVTYSGHVYNWVSTERPVETTAGWSYIDEAGTTHTSVAWNASGTGDDQPYVFLAQRGQTDSTNNGDTIHFSAEGSTVKNPYFSFTPLVLGGIIVDADATGFSLEANTSSTARKVYLGNNNDTEARTVINENFTLYSANGRGEAHAENSINTRGTQTWTVATGKNFYLNSGNTARNLDGTLTINGGGTVTFKGAGVTNIIGTVTVENGSSLTMDNDNARYTGTGHLILNSATQAGYVSGKFNDAWSGTLTINSSAIADINLNNYGTVGSVVEFNGVSKHFAGANGKNGHPSSLTFNPTLKLSGDGLTLTDGYSDSVYIFKGGITGTGNFTFAPTTTASNQTYSFTGSVADWTGIYKNTRNVSNLIFSDNATVMGAEIKKDGGDINVQIGTGEAEFQTTFKKAVNATQLTVKDNASVTFEKGFTGKVVMEGKAGTLTATSTDWVKLFNASDVHDLSVKKLNFNTGAVSVAMGGTNSTADLDLAGSNNISAVLTLEENASLSLTGSMWLRQNGGKLQLKEGATFNRNGVTVKGLSSTEGNLGVIARTQAASDNTYTFADTTATISNAEVSVDVTGGNKTIGNTLSNVKLVSTDTPTVGNKHTLTVTDASLSAVNLESGLSINGTVSLAGATTEPNAIATFLGLAANKSLAVSDGAKLGVNGTAANHGVWMNAGSSITVSDNSSLTVAAAGLTFAGTTITNTSKTAEAQIGNHSSGGTRSDISVSGGSVTVTEGTESVEAYSISNSKLIVESGNSTTIGASLSDSDLLVTGSGTEASFSGKDLTVNNMTLAAGTTVTLGSKGSHNHTLAVQSLTVNSAAESPTTLNANLDLTDTTTLTLNGALTMGCELNLGDGGIELGGTLLDQALALTEVGDSVTLFNGVDSVTDYTSPWEASTIFSNDALKATDTKNYLVVFNSTDKTVNLTVVPEPATATLSLLALAALAARRRRR